MFLISHTGVLEGPKNVTAFTNQVANFSCVTTTGSTHWEVNQTAFEDLSSELKTDVTIHGGSSDGILHFFTLSILARLRYNGTKVNCEDESESQTACLTVQGLKNCVICFTSQKVSFLPRLTGKGKWFKI